MLQKTSWVNYLCMRGRWRNPKMHEGQLFTQRFKTCAKNGVPVPMSYFLSYTSVYLWFSRVLVKCAAETFFPFFEDCGCHMKCDQNVCQTFKTVTCALIYSIYIFHGFGVYCKIQFWNIFGAIKTRLWYEAFTKNTWNLIFTTKLSALSTFT